VSSPAAPVVSASTSCVTASGVSTAAASSESLALSAGSPASSVSSLSAAGVASGAASNAASGVSAASVSSAVSAVSKATSASSAASVPTASLASGAASASGSLCASAASSRGVIAVSFSASSTAVEVPGSAGVSRHAGKAISKHAQTKAARPCSIRDRSINDLRISTPRKNGVHRLRQRSRDQRGGALWCVRQHFCSLAGRFGGTVGPPTGTGAAPPIGSLCLQPGRSRALER
jgi:hypothetical protein